MNITRRDFFESIGLDSKQVFERVYGRFDENSYQKFLDGNIADTIQMFGREIRDKCLADSENDMPYWFRIGADATLVNYRHALPVDPSVRERSLSSIIQQYVMDFNVEAFGEEYDMSEKEKEVIRTKHSGIQAKLSEFFTKGTPKLFFAIPYGGPEQVSLNTPVSACLSYSIGVLQEDSGIVFDEEGNMLFYEHNIIDIVVMEDNKGGTIVEPVGVPEGMTHDMMVLFYKGLKKKLV
ncbi:MAG: hypothetical protein ABIB71_08910 [Candidatus Woesearchaeota archaeon]